MKSLKIRNKNFYALLIVSYAFIAGCNEEEKKINSFTLSGQVYLNGQGESGISVVLSGQDSVITDVGGFYEIKGIPQGTYELIIAKTFGAESDILSFSQKRHTVELLNNMTLDLEFFTPIQLHPTVVNSNNQVTVSWSPTSDIDFTEYRVYSGDSININEGNAILLHRSTGLNDTVFIHNRTENTESYYRVYAYSNRNLLGNSNIAYARSLINNLKIYRNGVLSSEYIYNDNYQLQRETVFDSGGRIIYNFDYSYINGLISKTVVMHVNNTDSIVQHVYFEHSIMGFQNANMTNKIVMTTSHQYGSYKAVPQYPYSLAFNVLANPIQVFTIEYRVEPNGNLSAFYGRPYFVAFEFDNSGNLTLAGESYIAQRDTRIFYEYDETHNIFNKFGLIKFDAKWLSKNNHTEMDAVTWFDGNPNPLRITGTYEYLNPNEEGFPLLVKETRGTTTTEYAYKFFKQ